MSAPTLHPYLEKALRRQDLTEGEARGALDLVFSGTVSVAQVAAWLVALRMKGESPEEITGFARTLRERMTRVDPGDLDEPLVDTCGTGGDGGATFNISTVAAFVVAAAGARVAKHGNRSISSKCGSADLLEALGVEVAIPPERMGEAIREVGIGFLFAPMLHPAMKHAQAARLELKTRTMFNMLGPLANPAGAKYQLIGAYSPRAAELMAQALANLGCEHGFVVHAEDGLDEITTTGTTHMWEVRPGGVTPRTITPEDFGVERATLHHLRGGTKDENCRYALEVLRGEKSSRRDIVLVNAAAALVAAGVAQDFKQGVKAAQEAIDSGRALARSEALARFTQKVAQGSAT